MRKSWMAMAFASVVAVTSMASPVEARDHQRYNRCRNCGTVTEIYRDRGQDRHLGGGTVIGAVVGAALGNQVGDGDGRKAATVAGALAGGAVGHRVEKNRRGDRDYYRVEIEMDNGGHRTVTMVRNRDSLRRGDRVQVRNGDAYLIRQ